MVRVTVVYSSIFARLAGKSREILELEDGTISGLLHELTQRYPQPFVEALVDPSGALQSWVAVVVNGRVATPTTALTEGDEAVLLLSFEGG